MMQRLGGARRAGSVGIVSVVLLAACAGIGAGGDDGDAPAGGEVGSESGSSGGEVGSAGDGSAAGGLERDSSEGDDDFGEPRPEDTTEEPPADVQIDSTRIEVATLPIGGSADLLGEDLQCVDVGWSEPPVIPTGVAVVIQALVFEPAGQFALADQPCPGDEPPCRAGHPITPTQRCALAIEAWPETSGDTGGWLSASGTIICDAPPDVCSAFATAVAERGGQSIELLPLLAGAALSTDGEGQEGGGPDRGTEPRDDLDQPGDDGVDEAGHPGAGRNGEQVDEQDGEQDGEQDADEDGSGNGEG
jgi:hypothetical protein